MNRRIGILFDTLATCLEQAINDSLEFSEGDLGVNVSLMQVGVFVGSIECGQPWLVWRRGRERVGGRIFDFGGLV